MAQIEELKIMTPATGADLPFMATVFPQGLAITEYTLQKTRMGMPSLTATLMCERCLDNDWTGKEYVTCQGEKYYIRQKPSSSKSSDDVRYKHELEFVGEREVLAGVYFYDVASVSAAEDYKPRTDMTDFKMVGTLAEYAARLNCSLVYTGVGDSGIRSATASDFAAGRFAARGDGYCVQIPADTEIDLSKYVEVETEDQYFWDALKAIAEAFETEFAVEGKVIYLAPKEKVLEGFNLEYGADNELVSVRKANKGDKTVNEATAVGSSENIPYYYPNDTEYGVVQVHVSSGNKVLTDLSMLTVSRLSNLLLRARENAPVQFHYLQRLDYSASSFQITDSEYNSHDWTTIAVGAPYEMEVEVNVAEGKKKQVPCKFDINVSQAGTYRLGVVGYASSTSRADVDLVKDNLVIMRQCYNAQWEQDTTYANGKIEIEIPNAGTYTVECEIIMGNEEGVELRLDVIKLENQNEDEAYWSCDGSGHYSASVLGISTSVEMGLEADGDSFYWAGTGRMPFQTRLVVPKFRNTQGAERFYRALNNVTGQYAPAYAGYEFPNPYDGIPSQRLYEYEDIKPTMDGVRNIHGQLFGEIAAVAFDDGDNDEVKAVDGESSSNSADYEHSYFYVKLRQMKYSDAAGTWDLDLFGMATQEEAMVLQMTSGRCAGCKFQVQVMADPAPDGRWVNPVQAYENGDIYAGDQYSKISTVESQEWQQDTSAREVWIALKKETETFGVVMPNAEHGYRPQGPHVDSVTGEMVEGDTFNVININLPKCYILAAEERLQAAMMEDMRKDNEDKFVFEASLSRIWAAENPDLAAQIDENTTVRILYNGQEWTQKVSSLTVSASSGDALAEIRLDLCDEIAAEATFIDRAVAKTVAKIGSTGQQNVSANKSSAPASRSDGGSAGATVAGSGGTSIRVIKSSDTAEPTDANVYSALRSRSEFVTVADDQRVQGKKTFKDKTVAESGLDVGVFIQDVGGAQIDRTGNAEIESLKVRSNAEIEGDATFSGSAQFGQSFISGLVGGRIDAGANGELESLRLRSWLEVPELRFNRATVLLGDQWQAPGGGIIESVTVDTDGDGNLLRTGTVTLKLEDGEIGAVAVDDICKGYFHDFKNTANNATEDAIAEDETIGNTQFAGFCTVFFRITEIVSTDGSNKTFKYMLRPESANWLHSFHPYQAMHFVSYGSFTNAERQNSAYQTRTYTRYLKGVDDWEFKPQNVMMQLGDLSNLSILGYDLDGYSAFLQNIYMTGTIANVKVVTPAVIEIETSTGDTFIADGETITLTATVKRGWETLTADAWSISRDSGDAQADAAWNAAHASFNGTITLSQSDIGASTLNANALFTLTASGDGWSATKSITLRTFRLPTTLTMRFVSEYGEYDTFVSYGDKVRFQAVIEDALRNDYTADYNSWSIERHNGDTADDLAADGVWNVTRASISDSGAFSIEWSAEHDDLQAERATFVVTAQINATPATTIIGTLSI